MKPDVGRNYVLQDCVGQVKFSIKTLFSWNLCLIRLLRILKTLQVCLATKKINRVDSERTGWWIFQRKWQVGQLIPPILTYVILFTPLLQSSITFHLFLQLFLFNFMCILVSLLYWSRNSPKNVYKLFIFAYCKATSSMVHSCNTLALQNFIILIEFKAWHQTGIIGEISQIQLCLSVIKTARNKHLINRINVNIPAKGQKFVSHFTWSRTPNLFFIQNCFDISIWVETIFYKLPILFQIKLCYQHCVGAWYPNFGLLMCIFSQHFPMVNTF